jgi:hypothetical protein
MSDKHDSPCGRMHIVANVYNDPAGYSDTLVGLSDLQQWPLYWFYPQNEDLDCCFALVFHEPGVTREEAETFVRYKFGRGGLRDEWYE